jgi:NAD+ diphosphatase
MHKREHPDGLFAAHPFAIAHHLIGQWLHDGSAARA